MKVPWGVKSFVEGLLYWREFDEESRRFFHGDAKSLSLRYEDLNVADSFRRGLGPNLRVPRQGVREWDERYGRVLPRSAEATRSGSRM